MSGRAPAALAAAAALFAAGCGGDTPRAHHRPSPRARAAAIARLPLPLDRAVAQLFSVGFAGGGPHAPVLARLRTRDWGVLVLHGANARSLAATQAFADAARRAGTRGGGVAPLLAAAPGTVPGAQVAPQPAQRLPGPSATAAASALRAAGVGMALAPDADLGVVAGPAADRAFSDDPADVARKTAAAVAGYTSAGVASVVAHFPGEGAASRDPTEGTATVGLAFADLRRADMRPFAAVARTAPVIQLSDAVYAAFDGVTPATLLPESVALLRRGLRFAGVVMSGDLNAATAATGGTVAQAAVDALRAGDDLLYVPGDARDQEAAYRAVLRAARTGAVPVARVADALRRVLALKRAYAVAGPAG